MNAKQALPFRYYLTQESKSARRRSSPLLRRAVAHNLRRMLARDSDVEWFYRSERFGPT